MSDAVDSVLSAMGRPELQGILPTLLAQELDNQRARRAATTILDQEEIELARGERHKRTALEYLSVPQPSTVIDGVLAAEVNLLGGPSGAGKSLLARDWALSVASGRPWMGHAVTAPRNVLWVGSEGFHDFTERWSTQPLWNEAAGNTYVLDVPVNLVSPDDEAWLLKEYAAERPGLVVFDVVYGMGLPDDNGTKNVVPLINALKRISAEWGCATLAIGHNGHNGERRFRGSSAWRQLAAVEWHFADAVLSCEKSKIADVAKLRKNYKVEYPQIRWTSVSEQIGDEARVWLERRDLILADVDVFPNDTHSKRADRLTGGFALSHSRTRRLISEVLAEFESK